MESQYSKNIECPTRGIDVDLSIFENKSLNQRYPGRYIPFRIEKNWKMDEILDEALNIAFKYEGNPEMN